MKTRFNIFCTLLITVLSCSSITPNDGYFPKNIQTNSGHHYSIFEKSKHLIEFRLGRPDTSDSSIVLSIPAAFTDLKNYRVDGLYIHKGKVYHLNKINYTLGGALIINNGEAEIINTNRGKLLNDSLIHYLAENKASLFQQIFVVFNGKAESFKDNKEFQRRAIVTLKNGNTAVIESVESITLRQFAEDLVEIGAERALYTDMGAWDEGWYRSKNNEVISIGKDRSRTEKQSNWVVFKKQ